jgi:hypothetical protein
MAEEGGQPKRIDEVDFQIKSLPSSCLDLTASWIGQPDELNKLLIRLA